MHTRSLNKAAGWLFCGLLAIAAIAAFMLASPSGAKAASIPAQGNTVATVSIAQQTTLSDNTASLVFNAPVSLPAPATNNPQPVQLMASTNDPNGAQILVNADSPNFIGATTGPNASFPASSLTDQTALSDNPLSTAPNAVDVLTHAGSQTYTDMWSLTNIPNTAPDTYSLTIDYSINPL
jgi:hypothetical protein